MKGHQLFGSRIEAAPLFLPDRAQWGSSWPVSGRRIVKSRFLFHSLIGAALVYAAAFALVFAGASPRAAAAIFVVNSLGDGGDPSHGDGFCETAIGNDECTLRAAIEETNALAGTDSIHVNVTGAINLLSELPNISQGLTITGPGADQLTVQRSSGTNFRIFRVTSADTVTFRELTIANGNAANIGGGIDNEGNTVNITRCRLRDNSAYNGGGIYNDSAGTLNVTDSIIANNHAGLGGGAVNNAGSLSVTNSTIADNNAKEGGGIFNTGVATIRNSMLSGNTAAGFPASGQSAFGGGIYNIISGAAIISLSTFSGNSATGASTSASKGGEGRGGAILNNAYVLVANCTFSSNLATGGIGFGATSTGGLGVGGGISNYQGGTLLVENSTFSGNSATGGSGMGGSGSSGGEAFGGAIYGDDGSLTLTNSTIAGNLATGGSGPSTVAGYAGGVFPSAANASVKSTIIAKNIALNGPDVYGTFSSQGFNLIGKTDGSISFTAATDKTGTIASPLDPKLDPNGLQNNGGPTQTIALLFGSPAIDNATSSGLTGNLATDQRGTGFARTFDDLNVPNAAGGDGTDIGAFELQTAAPTPTPTPSASPTPTPTPTPTPSATPTTLGNISTRLRVETGDDVLIGGFIITGTQDKKVIVRAIGPSLPVADALADPFLELHDGSGALLDSNDNWVDSSNKQAIIDSTIPPSNDLESAIVATLPANSSAYTAIVRGVNNTTGVGLVEVYDLDRSVDSKLANISTRGLVQTGDNVMIGGFIVLGQSSQKIIARAIGPSLPVGGALADPTLELHNGNGDVIAFDDNWKDSQQAEIEATTIPPTNDLESAIVATLTPGNYTAIVRGLNDTTGVALVEVYALN
jgi:CSLREA domain-containing protein